MRRLVVTGLDGLVTALRRAARCVETVRDRVEPYQTATWHFADGRTTRVRVRNLGTGSFIAAGIAWTPATWTPARTAADGGANGPALAVADDGHSAAIACTRGRPKPCAYCGQPGGLLCDGPGKQSGKTCDVSMCARCTHSPSAGVDHCRDHRKEPTA